MLRIPIWLWMTIIVFQSQVVASFNYCKLKCPHFDPPFGVVLLPGPSKSHFYKCNFGVGILFKCSRKTHFNPRKKVCDWPWRARAVACHGSPDYEGEGSGDDNFYVRIKSERPERLYDTVRDTKDGRFIVPLKDNNKQKKKRVKVPNKTRFFRKRTSFCPKRGERHFHSSEEKHC